MAPEPVSNSTSDSPEPEPPQRRPPRSSRERAQEQRDAKLESVREQVENGSLVIRQMTEEERRRNAPRAPRPNRGGRR